HAGRGGRGEPQTGALEVRCEAAESGAGEISVSRGEGAIESDATQRISFAESPGDRPGLRQRPGGKVYLLDDVGWQEEHGAACVLRRDGPGGEKDQRRCVEDFQEGRREREAGAGSEDAARGRRELSGSGGSKPFSQAVAGHSLAAAVFAGTRGQDDGGQAGR